MDKMWTKCWPYIKHTRKRQLIKCSARRVPRIPCQHVNGPSVQRSRLYGIVACRDPLRKSVQRVLLLLLIVRPV